MQIKNMKHDELENIMTLLDQALHNHQQWHNALIRTLVCRLPCDKHDIAPNADHECLFGQWYHNNAPKNITEHPGFIAIDEAHKNMHGVARDILTNMDHSNIISTSEYDNFANTLERLRLEILAFKNELTLLFYTRDPLTMAINRINMLPILREQQDLIKRQGYPCCLAMMDLDSFKKINDAHGHLAGDKVIAAVTHHILEKIRRYDKLFRYGGEEFLLYLQKVTLEQGHEMIDRLREEIAKMPINAGLESPLYITVSFGVAMLDENLPIEQSIDRADKALYLAKSSGKNCTQIWKP